MENKPRVSLFNLKENKVYAAIDKAGKRLSRMFFKKDGKLYNQDGNVDTEAYEKVAVGCAWVPKAEKWVFEEVEVPIAKIEEKSEAPQDSVLNVKEGFIYQWVGGPLSGETYVLRESDTLYFCSKIGLKGAKVKEDRISLANRFVEVGPIKSEPDPVVPEVVEKKSVSMFQKLEERQKELVPA